MQSQGTLAWKGQVAEEQHVSWLTLVMQFIVVVSHSPRVWVILFLKGLKAEVPLVGKRLVVETTETNAASYSFKKNLQFQFLKLFLFFFRQYPLVSHLLCGFLAPPGLVVLQTLVSR